MILLGQYYPSASPAGIYAFNRYDTKIYSFKILERTTLVRNFVPIKRKNDNVFGLYDKINVFFIEAIVVLILYIIHLKNID